MKIKPGEIWLADLGLAAKARPVLVVSREDDDPPRALVIHVPLTTQGRGSRYEVDLGKLRFLSGMQPYRFCSGTGRLEASAIFLSSLHESTR